MQRTTRFILSVAVIALLGAGCADNNKTVAVSGNSSAPPQTATSTTAAAQTLPEAVTATVDGGAKEFAYNTTVTSVKAGPVKVSLTNNGAQEHQATLVRLHPGVDVAAIAAAGASDPTGAAVFKLFDPAGGPNGVAPGATVSSTQVLAPGNYLMACFIPDPTDGVPHAAKGMIQPFTVADNPAITDLKSVKLGTASTPQAGLTEFAFNVPDTVTATDTVHINNTGTQPHEMAIYKLADGKTTDDMKAFLLSTGAPTGPPPFSPAGGVSALAPGTEITVDVNLKPGSYALICFLPDTAGSGKAHFELGMLKQVSAA
jgi:plastocyanin